MRQHVYDKSVYMFLLFKSTNMFDKYKKFKIIIHGTNNI